MMRWMASFSGQMAMLCLKITYILNFKSSE